MHEHFAEFNMVSKLPGDIDNVTCSRNVMRNLYHQGTMTCMCILRNSIECVLVETYNQ